MNKFIKLLACLLLLALGTILAGCTSGSNQDSSIPWSRPATWEGQLPGMGGSQGQGR